MTLTSPQGYNNATQDFTNNAGTGEQLILNMFVTDKNPANSDRNLVYLANMPNACASANFGQNQVMTMNVVYFVKDNTLWRRTLAVDNYASKACAGATMWQRPSCAPGQVSTMCSTQDEKLIYATQGITLTVNYYASPSSTSPVAAAKSGSDSTRQSAMDTAKTVGVTIQANNTTAGRAYTQQGLIRVSRVGSLVKYATPS